MKWTTTKPTQPGYYYRSSLSADVSDCLEFDGEDWLLKDGQYSTDPIENDPPDMKYAGPLPEPSNDGDSFDRIAEHAKANGISHRGIHICYLLGVDVYTSVVRMGGFFPHHT